MVENGHVTPSLCLCGYCESVIVGPIEPDWPPPGISNPKNKPHRLREYQGDNTLVLPKMNGRTLRELGLHITRNP